MSGVCGSAGRGGSSDGLHRATGQSAQWPGASRRRYFESPLGSVQQPLTVPYWQFNERHGRTKNEGGIAADQNAETDLWNGGFRTTGYALLSASVAGRPAILEWCHGFACRWRAHGCRGGVPYARDRCVGRCGPRGHITVKLDGEIRILGRRTVKRASHVTYVTA